MRFFEYASPAEINVRAHDGRHDKDFKKQMPLHNRFPPAFPSNSQLAGVSTTAPVAVVGELTLRGLGLIAPSVSVPAHIIERGLHFR
jgi:hypothetical protein